ncbi:MAG: B12-binding domain-containing radical SAM protein [Promethearchaeota archaeon]
MLDKKLQLLLISPVNQDLQESLYVKKSYTFYPIGLKILEVLTPDNWNVKIIDETIEKFSFTECDLVGISAQTPNINRAYEIALMYREKGIKTIMGGPHPSAMPEEALKYVDTVVFGEGEMIWQDILRDFGKGELKQRYTGVPCPGNKMVNLDHSKEKDYEVVLVESSRGCPFNCEYCFATRFFGSNYRRRPIEDVVNEIQTIKQRIFMFSDDNFFGFTKAHIEEKRELLQLMIDRKIRPYWLAQTSINIVEHEDVLRLAHKAGCRAFVIGFESLSEKVLESMNKTINMNYLKTRDYCEAIKIIHKNNIGIIAATMYGMDDDNIESLSLLEGFFRKCKPDALDPAIVTPFPGTPLYDRIKKEGRLLQANYPKDWNKYDLEHPLISPVDMTTKEFFQIYSSYLKRINDIYNQKLRFWRILFRTRSLVAAVGLNRMCSSYENRIKNEMRNIELLLTLKRRK